MSIRKQGLAKGIRIALRVAAVGIGVGAVTAAAAAEANPETAPPTNEANSPPGIAQEPAARSTEEEAFHVRAFPAGCNVSRGPAAPPEAPPSELYEAWLEEIS
jgi:hypothetical protein